MKNMCTSGDIMENNEQNQSESTEKPTEKPIDQPLSPEAQKLKDQLAALWTVCPAPNQGSEHDQFIDGIESDDTGASRIVGSGKGAGGSGVRIKFRGK
jgi:hypothetical protein